MTNYTYSYILTEPILAIRHSELLMRRLSNKTRTFFTWRHRHPLPSKSGDTDSKAWRKNVGSRPYLYGEPLKFTFHPYIVDLAIPMFTRCKNSRSVPILFKTDTKKDRKTSASI